MLASVLAFLNTVDPSHALFGAAVLFLVQLLGGKSVPDLSGFLKNLTAPKPAPVPVPVPTGPTKADHPLADAIAEAVRARFRARIAAGEDPVKVLAELAK